MTIYGPNNPHPLSRMKSELVWEGKYDEFGNRREINTSNLSLPLQKIETIDEPRSRAEEQGSLFDPEKSHRDDFRNRLIWGDNKLVLASLVQEFKGRLEMIYIDPPFDVGADFTLEVPIGDEDETLEKAQSILEMVAYRDMWGTGTDSYLNIMYERLLLMKELLTETGSIYVHCDTRVNSFLRLILNDIFGRQNFINQITWRRTAAHNDPGRYGMISDTILFFHKGEDHTWNQPYGARTDEAVDKVFRYAEKPNGEVVNVRAGEAIPSDWRRFQSVTLRSPNPRPNLRYDYKGFKPHKNGWSCNIERMQQYDAENRLIFPRNPEGALRLKMYLDESPGVPVQDLWTDINKVEAASQENLNYQTQKPEALLERIIQTSSNEGDIVGDFFCGSGTTGVVAEKLGRRWVMADLGRFAIHTTRKRLIGLQRDLHEESKPYRSFDLYNLGRYERQWWQKESLRGADDEHRAIVLKFFKAEVLTKAPSPLLHARRGAAFVHVDGIDSIFTRNEVKELAQAVAVAGGREVYVLAWDFEMDIRQVVAAVEAETGVKLRLARIPREIMEKNRTEVPPFFEVAVLEAAPVIRKEGSKRKVDIKIENFLPSLSEVPSKELEALQERAVESGFDFIDFWAIDFDWKPNRPFNHHWQDFRTRRDRTLKTVSDAEHVYPKPGKYTACVKVVDVFGCDTSITVEVMV